MRAPKPDGTLVRRATKLIGLDVADQIDEKGEIHKQPCHQLNKPSTAAGVRPHPSAPGLSDAGKGTKTIRMEEKVEGQRDPGRKLVTAASFRT